MRCLLPKCRGRTVGWSRWCRKHTDEIVEGRECPRLTAFLAAERAKLARWNALEPWQRQLEALGGLMLAERLRR